MKQGQQLDLVVNINLDPADINKIIFTFKEEYDLTKPAKITKVYTASSEEDVSYIDGSFHLHMKRTETADLNTDVYFQAEVFFANGNIDLTNVKRVNVIKALALGGVDNAT